MLWVKRKIKRKKLKSTIVLEIVDRTEYKENRSTDELSTVYLKQPKPESTDKIVEFSSIEDFNKLYKDKGECSEEE